jgi:hypothetical protein
LPAERIGSGLLGNVFPIFRLREVLAQRVLGAPLGQLKQQQYIGALETDLSERARRGAREYQMNAESRFQQRAFEDFVIRCQDASIRRNGNVVSNLQTAAVIESATMVDRRVIAQFELPFCVKPCPQKNKTALSDFETHDGAVKPSSDGVARNPSDYVITKEKNAIERKAAQKRMSHQLSSDWSIAPQNFSRIWERLKLWRASSRAFRADWVPISLSFI